VAPSGECLQRQAWCNLQVNPSDPCLSALYAKHGIIQMLSVNIHSVVLSCMTVCLLCCEMSLQCVNGSIKMVSDGITLKAHCTAFHCTNESSGSFVPFFTNSVLT